MVALRRDPLAWAFLPPRQVLEAAVKRRHSPARQHGLNHQFTRQVRRQVVGNDPFNAAVRGYPREEPYAKGRFFQAHFLDLAPALGAAAPAC